ncbi:MAG: hypothetical protein R3F02_11475 [Thiolinea sp.]
MKQFLTLAAASGLLSACTSVPVPVTPGLVLPNAMLRPAPVFVPQADPVIAQPAAVNNNTLPVTPAIAIPASYTPAAVRVSTTPTIANSTDTIPVIPVFVAPASTLPKATGNSLEDLNWLAARIMKNEAGGDPQKLLNWNERENFATLGIGHFIWYPANNKGRYTESFPAFVEYARAHNATLPRWLANQYKQGAPWANGATFSRAQNDPQYRELRDFLQKSQNLQANFMAARLQQTIPVMLQTLPAQERQRVQNNYQTVLKSPGGLYPLLDYVQFKGNGLNPAERYQNQGWGLLQVLQDMQTTEPGPAALAEFRRAADDVLVRRIANAPASSREARYLSGWLNRISTYNPGRSG